ncbi:LKHA4-like protein, partial [Mya arenaria]
MPQGCFSLIPSRPLLCVSSLQEAPRYSLELKIWHLPYQIHHPGSILTTFPPRLPQPARFVPELLVVCSLPEKTAASRSVDIGGTVNVLRDVGPLGDHRDGLGAALGGKTSPECSALQWLRPEQTAGKRQPYLFSQCEIKAPSVVKVLMSALLEGSEKTEDGQMVHSFRQNQPMPSYLIAIVAGDIVSKEIGPRSKVWTEPELIEAAAYEFAETESMLQAGEGLLGPYVWGHYDLLVLPPSFPYGGMENPCLTFVTPTLLAGDRSLADVVAHEIAHSWTGNLVTNASWSDFWLNEGFTVFVERKIVSRLKDSEVYRQFLASRGWRILTETIKQLGAENKFTCLVPDMLGVDPDESFSSVPYEKGQAFLFYLEQLLGGPDWKAFLLEYFNTEEDAGKLATVDWQGWMYDTSLAENCEELRNRWLGLSDDQLTQFTLSDIEDFQPMQIEQFLSGFADHDPISCAKIDIGFENFYNYIDLAD